MNFLDYLRWNKQLSQLFQKSFLFHDYFLYYEFSDSKIIVLSFSSTSVDINPIK